MKRRNKLFDLIIRLDNVLGESEIVIRLDS